MYSKVSQLHISMDPLFFRFFSHMGHYGSIEYSSLCYTLSSYWLSILYVVVCICESQSPNLSLSPCHSSLVIISLFSTSVTLFLKTFLPVFVQMSFFSMRLIFTLYLKLQHLSLALIQFSLLFF